jgi:hypothetical protein
VPQYLNSVPLAKYCLGPPGRFAYHNLGSPIIYWQVVPPYYRKIYNFETRSWSYLDYRAGQDLRETVAIPVIDRALRLRWWVAEGEASRATSRRIWKDHALNHWGRMPCERS